MSRRDDGEPRLAPFRHPDHPRPVTRRQFLAQGFISGAALLAAPSLLGLFRSPAARAQALACGVGGPGGKLPFLVFDLGGGASIAGSNVLVGTNGQLDGPLSPEGYTRMGLPADRRPTDPAFVDTSLGLAFHAESALLRGIRRRAQPATLDNVNGCIFCARSDNDTENNPHNPMYGINRAGANGRLLALVGTRSSESGGRSVAPASMVDPTVRPAKVESPREARGLVDTGKLLELLEPADAAAVMAAAEAISSHKVARIQEEELVKQLIECSYVETTDLVTNFGDPNALDPLGDPLLTAIVPESDFDRRELRRTASVMKLVLDDFAGAGTIELPGYDYHDGTRATGERRDESAGEAIGAALEYAAALGKPLVIYVLSDGSVASDGVVDDSQDGAGKLVWRSDNAGTAATFLLVYDPMGRPELTGTGHQIGRFRPSGAVETAASVVGDNVTLLTQAVVLNYLALHGEVGRLSSVLPGNGLGASSAQLDPLIAFAPLPRFAG